MGNGVQPSLKQEQQETVKVFIIDDSQLMCKVLEKVLAEDPGIEIAGHALNGQEALRNLRSMRCDVCTLDVHMPGMNGLSVLKHIMIQCPLPTLMVSAFTADGSRVTFEALRYGAVDFFQKPARDKGEDIQSQAEMLRAKVKRAARVQVGAARYLRLRPVASSTTKTANRTESATISNITIITASTGGYSSLLSLLPMMQYPPKAPVIVSLGTATQFMDPFIDYLSSFVSFPVIRAKNGMQLKNGTVFFISGNESATLEKNGDKIELIISPRPDMFDLEGGVDLLMFSASELFGEDTVGIFLSGDRPEGLSGAREIVRNKGKIIVQRPETCLSPDQPLRIFTEVGAESLGLSELAQNLSSSERSQS